MMTDQYRDITGCIGYRVGSDGSLWSCRPLNGRGPLLQEWRKLRAKITSRGYHEVSIRGDDGRDRYFRVNRLVAMAFIPNPDQKPEVNHKDGVKGNNAATNLEWVTRSENELHAFETGLKQAKRGDQSAVSKLREESVLAIISRLRAGDRVGKLAREYGVHQTTISDIKLGRSWTHVTRLGGVS